MENNSKKINWFIGHMKKTIDILEDKKKNVDFIIELLDSRLIKTSSNNDLIKIFNNKLIIKIAVKSDLLDLSNVKKDKDIIYCSIKKNKDRQKIISFIENKLSAKIEKLKSKGLVNPIFVGLVVGLPNIGKSSFINFLSDKKQVIVENRPGVTKKVENIKISKNLVLLDTPGVFIKNVESYNDGLNLALINSINRNVVDKKELAKHLYDILDKKQKLKIINQHFGIEEFSSFDDFINKLIVKRHIIKDDQIENLYTIFVKEIFDSGLAKIDLENET